MAGFFTDKLVCVCCERETHKGDRRADRVQFVAVSLYLTFRGRGKSSVSNAGKVRICTDCLARVLASSGIFQGAESRKFLAALRERVSARYSALLERDAEELPTYATKTPAELRRELFGGKA